MTTLEYVGQRLLQAVPLLLLLSIVVFAMMHAAPGDPAVARAGARATEADIERLRQAMGLDQPIVKQYGIWLSQTIRGDFGDSFINNRPVMTLIKDRFWPTVLLMGMANTCSLILAIPLGVFAAVKQYSFGDSVMTVLTFIGISIPSFWLALLLMWLFGVELSLLPVSGMRTAGDPLATGDVLRHLAMPLTVLTFVFTAFWMRFVRSGILDVLAQDYVLFARSKGLPPLRLLGRHVLRNGLLPLITLVGLSVPELVTGTVVIEAVFGWPGLGSLMLQSANSRDFSVVMALVMLASLAVVIGNLMADISYRWADPRIRY